jgi:site-specific DNA recombinase
MEEALFEEVQSILAANRRERVSRHNQHPSPLSELLFDADGERLTPSHALKKSVRYRYYVSRHLITGDKTEARGLRLPAPGIEALIRTRIEALLANPEELTSILQPDCDRAAIVSSAMRKGKDFASLSAVDLGLALNSFVSRISMLSDRVAITIQPDALAAWILGVSTAEREEAQKTTIITALIRVQQRGQEIRLVFDAEDEMPTGHNALVRLLARAHTIRRRLFEERPTIGEVAEAENLIPSYVTRLVRLTFLAPDITTSILSGRHDPDLTVSRLMADTRFPLDWKDQRRSCASA